MALYLVQENILRICSRKCSENMYGLGFKEVIFDLLSLISSSTKNDFQEYRAVQISEQTLSLLQIFFEFSSNTQYAIMFLESNFERRG